MLKTPVLPDAKLGFLDGLKRYPVNRVSLVFSIIRHSGYPPFAAGSLPVPYQVTRTAQTTRRPLFRVYSQVDRAMSLSP